MQLGTIELRFLARFQWREAYVLDNWQLAELPQSGGREQVETDRISKYVLEIKDVLEFKDART